METCKCMFEALRVLQYPPYGPTTTSFFLEPKTLYHPMVYGTTTHNESPMPCHQVVKPKFMNISHGWGGGLGGPTIKVALPFSHEHLALLAPTCLPLLVVTPP